MFISILLDLLVQVVHLDIARVPKRALVSFGGGTAGGRLKKFFDLESSIIVAFKIGNWLVNKAEVAEFAYGRSSCQPLYVVVLVVEGFNKRVVGFSVLHPVDRE